MTPYADTRPNAVEVPHEEFPFEADDRRWSPHSPSSRSPPARARPDSGGSSGGKTEITLLTDNAETTVKPAKAVIAAFEKANPTITVKTETRPGGSDGDNLVKTKLSTGDMADVFWYNSGSLLQALSPEKTLVDLTNDPALKDTDPSFLPAVTQNGKVYGAPWGTAMGGGILYNKDVYSQLGLSVPKTWAEFESNSDKIKAAGITPVLGTLKDTFTSQLYVLGDFHNVAAAEPQVGGGVHGEQGQVRAPTRSRVKGFEKAAEPKAKGWLNSSAGSTTFAQGIKLLAQGKAAQYPMLTFPISTLSTGRRRQDRLLRHPRRRREQGRRDHLGPGRPVHPQDEQEHRGRQEVRRLRGLDRRGRRPTPPPSRRPARTSSRARSCPTTRPPVAKDMQAYIDTKTSTPALEFVSPVKGPSLEQIMVAVMTGQTPAQDGAAQYDADVTKQAKQLGLPGW